MLDELVILNCLLFNLGDGTLGDRVVSVRIARGDVVCETTDQGTGNGLRFTRWKLKDRIVVDESLDKNWGRIRSVMVASSTPFTIVDLLMMHSKPSYYY